MFTFKIHDNYVYIEYIFLQEMSETIKSEQKYVLWLKNSKNVFLIYIFCIFIFIAKNIFIYIYFSCTSWECKTSIS